MNKEEVFLIVKKVIVNVLPHVKMSNIEITQTLKSLGANSIDRTEILVLSMEKMCISLPLLSFAGIENIEELVDKFSDSYL